MIRIERRHPNTGALLSVNFGTPAIDYGFPVCVADDPEPTIGAKAARAWFTDRFTGRRVFEDQWEALETAKIGRNDPCLCGSGKKFKKCCGVQP